ncbi:MAG: DUF4261 domain-containing protein [Planctomycetota bacterium]
MNLNTPWLALIALSQEQLPSGQAIAEQLAERFPGAADFTATSETTGAVTFTYAPPGCAAVVGNCTVVDRPIPWERLEGPCATAWYWPEAAGALRGHAAHLFVTLMDDAKDPIDAAMGLTRITTAIAAAAPAVGLMWGPSMQVHKPADFAGVAGRMTRDDLPLHLWIDFRVSQRDPAEGGGFCLFTTGLGALGHREFEVPSYAGEPNNLAGAVYNITHYVLEKGPILKDGEAVGLPGGGQVNVSIGPSMIDGQQEVISLAFE